MTPLDALIARINAMATRATHRQETEVMQPTPPHRQPATDRTAAVAHIIYTTLRRAQLVRCGVLPQTEAQEESSAAYN